MDDGIVCQIQLKESMRLAGSFGGVEKGAKSGLVHGGA
jgi:hypothetical protein